MAEVWYTDIHPEHKHGKALIEGCGACPRCGGCDDLVARSGGRLYAACKQCKRIWAVERSNPDADPPRGRWFLGRYELIPARRAFDAEARFDAGAAAVLAEVNL